MSESDVTSYLQYLWVLVTAPIVIIFNKIMNHESRLSKVESVQTIKVEDIQSLQNCMKELSEKLANFSGQFDEHLRKK